MIEKQLKDFGLSNKEITVYLALLQLNIANVEKIARESKLNSSTTYIVLNSLKDKDLIYLDNRSINKKYGIYKPDNLLEKLEKSIQMYTKLHENINSLIPKLTNLSKNKKQKPKVLFFEGKEGMKNIYEDVLSSNRGSLMRAFSLPSVWDKIMPSYYEYLKNQRIERGIHLKAIHPYESRLKKVFNTDDAERLAEFAFLPQGQYTFSSDLRIYENKVALASGTEEFGILIEDEDIANTMKETFDLAWNQVKQLNSKS